MRRCEALDINRAGKELRFEPQFSVEEGIRKYAGWLENKLK
jgi:nucleoside-diphosphate-sugar epimerase